MGYWKSRSKTACRGFKSFCPCHSKNGLNSEFKPFLILQQLFRHLLKAVIIVGSYTENCPATATTATQTTAIIMMHFFFISSSPNNFISSYNLLFLIPYLYNRKIYTHMLFHKFFLHREYTVQNALLFLRNYFYSQVELL